jgi:hypothetical protein
MSLVGEKVTIGPNKRKTTDIKKSRKELEKKRRETYYQKKRYQIVDLRAKGWSMRKIAEYIGMSVGFVCKWCRRLAAQVHDKTAADRKGRKKRTTQGKAAKAYSKPSHPRPGLRRTPAGR